MKGIQECEDDLVCVWKPNGVLCGKRSCGFSYDDRPICTECLCLLKDMLRWSEGDVLLDCIIRKEAVVK